MEDFKFKIAGKNYTTKVVEQESGTLLVTVNGKTYEVEMPGRTPAPKPVIRPVGVAAAPVAAAPAAAAPAGDTTVVAPLPGIITKVVAKAGQKVKKGDVLVVMEAMKMANDIVAEADGTVKAVNVSEGQSVNQGDVLVDFVADAVAAAPAAPKAVPAPAAAPAAPKAAPAGANAVTAPLPGTITQILVKVGQQVKAGDTVVMMEAMKMENSITAEYDGTVKAILVQQGSQVQSGEALVEMA